MSLYEHKTNTEEQNLKRFPHNYNILVAKYEAQMTKLFGCKNLFENMLSWKTKPLCKKFVLFIIIGVWISIVKIYFSTVQASGL